jgi:hypothetical protein
VSVAEAPLSLGARPLNRGPLDRQAGAVFDVAVELAG